MKGSIIRGCRKDLNSLDSREIRVAAQKNFSWNQDMPEIIKDIVTINKFKELAPETKI